jgi:transposase InsO family protein
MPARPHSFTPVNQLHQPDHARHRDRLYQQLQPLIAANAAITEPFCTDPRSHVTLSVHPDNHKHVYKSQYPVAHSMRESISQILQRWFEMGRIVRAPPNCPFNSPLLPVPKKDENGRMTGVRLCIDVRNLNKQLEQNDRFLLPHIPDVLATFSGNSLFGEYDLSEAFYQFRIKDESQQYTAFTWDKTQYMCVGTPYGIKHIPSFFQRYMCQLFADMPFVYPYIDNIAFASRTWEEHHRHASAIIERLNAVNLKIKPSSINVGNTCLRLLGHVIDANGVSIDPEKQKMIMDWPEPKTGDILASALGLGAFLHDHIRHYSDITAPLEEAKKHKEIVWTDKLRQHWQLFKRAFSTAPVLTFPDFNKRFVLATDASQTGIGGILYQPDDVDNTITPTNIVAICSKKLDPTQRNYPVYKKELFAVIYCLRKFHSYIWGRQDVLVLTDHRPLIHILNQKTLSVALQQWLDVLLHYNLDIKYRPGVLHVVPDALSRMYMNAYTDTTSTWGTHDNIRILSSYNDPITRQSPSDDMCIESLDEIRPPVVQRRHRDTTFIMTMSTLDTSATSSSSASSAPPSHGEDNAASDDNYQVQWLYDIETGDTTTRIAPATTPSADNDDTDEGSLTTPISGRINERLNKTVPATDDERHRLVAAAHDHGHFGYTAIYTDLFYRRGYWWPHMRDDIFNVVKSCEQCQKYTVVKSGYHPARPIRALLPGDHYQIDFAHFTPSPEGYKYCLLLVDVFTGFLILRPLKDNTAVVTARALFEIFSIIGIPRILQSDNGDSFSADLIHALTHSLGIHHRFIAAYNPRADGKVERIVRTVKSTIMKLMRGANIFWPLHLPYVQYAYNDKIHTLTGSSPFALMFGRSPNLPIDYNRDAANDDADLSHYTSTSIDAWKHHQTQIVSLIYPAINTRVTHQQQKYINKLNTTRNIITKPLSPGTLVALKDPKFLHGKSIKPSHEPTYMGQYTIVRRLPTGPYIIKDETGEQLDRPVPLDQMRILFPPHTRRPSRNHDTTDNDDDNDIYAVQDILEHRLVDGHKLQYLVKWKGYTTKHNSWVDASDMLGTDIIHRYFKRVNDEQSRNTTTPAPKLRCVAVSMRQHAHMIYSLSDSSSSSPSISQAFPW